MRFYFDIREEELQQVYETFIQFKQNGISVDGFVSNGINGLYNIVESNKTTISRQMVMQIAEMISQTRC